MTVIRIAMRQLLQGHARSLGRLQHLLVAAALVVLAPAPVGATTSVTGVQGELLDNVLAYVDIYDLDCDTAAPIVRAALNRADDQAAEALNALGYYDPLIRLQLDSNEDCWHATIDIVPGEVVRLREVDLTLTGEAAERPEFQQLQAGSSLVPGAPLNHGDYEQLKRSLLDLARNRGFPEARFERSRIDVYPDELAADISLEFVSGPRYAIGEVFIMQSELESEFVNAYHDLVPGTPYDNRLLSGAFLNLNDSGYFTSVDVQALQPDPETLTIPIEVSLVPSPRRRISYGVGYSTDTGPRLRFGRGIRRLNRQGHQLTIDGQLSPVVSEVTAIYRRPFQNPRFDWLNFSLGAMREETDTSLARSVEGGVRRVVDRDRGWSWTQYLSYAVEDFEVASQAGRSHLLIPGVDWTRLRGDDALRPDRGAKLNIDLRAASDKLLSDSSFLQTTVWMKWIRRIAPRSRLLLRGRAGYLVDDDFAELPPSIRYFAGGDLSVRGFDFESLGPVDENGEVIGGNRLIELSAEYEYQLKPSWSLALFVDSGNAFNELGLDMRTGAGIGARWRSPLGPVRIDVAWPVNDPEHGARLHITLGPDL